MANIGEIVTAPEISSVWAINTPLTAGTADLIINRFDDTLGKAEEMLVRLVGADGASGYLGTMSSVVENAPQIAITAPFVDTSTSLAVTGLTLPVYDGSGIGTFPDDVYDVPVMSALPTIDTGDLTGVDAPIDIDPTYTFTSTTTATTLFDAVLSRMLVDLQSGATGLDPIVEQAIYDRARARQQSARDTDYQKLNNDISGRGFTLPPGALLSALTDFAAEGVRQDADITNNIIATQGDLAQKNSQFIITQSVALETLIRNTAMEKDKTNLEYLKSKATLLVQDYAERVRAYVAIWEGKKVKVQAQTEALRGVIEGNKGLIEIFKAQYDALKTRVEAVASKNKGITDTYLGQVQGFSAAETAIAARNSSAIQIIGAKIQAADLELRAAIAEAANTLSGYSSEMSIRERVAADMTHVAAQTIASMLSAVNASASLGYSGSTSESKSVSNSASLSESHSYEHDPVA
jgi:hypothetical protein